MNRAAPHLFAVALGAMAVALWMGAMAMALGAAALPDATAGPLLAVFPLGMGEKAAFTAMVRAGGRPVRATWLPFAWVVVGEEPGFVGRLKAEGALAGFGAVPAMPEIGGCAVISREDRRPPALDLARGPPAAGP